MSGWVRQVGSFDAGYGSTHMARLIGQKKAREMWFLARLYDAQQARALPSAVPWFPEEVPTAKRRHTRD